MMRCAHAVALFATTLVRGAVAQGPTNHLPNHGWQYHTACVPPNIAPAEVFDCMAKLSLVQWNCNATEGPGNTMNQILEAMQTTMTLQIETADSIVSLVSALAAASSGNGTSTTGIGAAAAVGLPDSFLDALGPGLDDGDLTADEVACTDGSSCTNDMCADGSACSSAAAALFNTLAIGIANNMNSASGHAQYCWCVPPPGDNCTHIPMTDPTYPTGCVSPDEILISDLSTGGRRRMQNSATGSDLYHTYCLDKSCSVTV